MRKGIDPPHIVALTIVVCAAIAPAFMLWGRTIGEWAVGIAVYTLITAVVLSLLVLDFVIVRYDVMALLIQALSGSEIVGSVSRLLFVLGQIWVIILSIRIPPSFWEKRLAVLPFQADPDNSALALCIGLASGAFLLVIVALWMPEDLPGSRNSGMRRFVWIRFSGSVFHGPRRSYSPCLRKATRSYVGMGC